MKMVRKKKEGASFRERFKDSLRYLGESKNYIWAVILVFLAGMIIGAAFSESLGFLDEMLKELVSQIEGLGTIGTILFILENNLKSALFSIVLGAALGVFPVISALSNGMIFGYVAKLTAIEIGALELWRVLPHGIFELPAIFIALALGIKLGMSVFSEKKTETFLTRAMHSLILFVTVVVPLLIVAAIIEGILISVSG